MHFIDLPELLVMGELILGIDAERLRRVARTDLAESALAAPRASFAGLDLYPDAASRGAILCARLVRNHPLPDGNKRLGLLAMLEFFARNGVPFAAPDGGDDEIADRIERLAAGTLAEEDFVAWVRACVDAAA